MSKRERMPETIVKNKIVHKEVKDKRRLVGNLVVQVEAFIGETVTEGIIVLIPVKGYLSSPLLAVFSNESCVC